MKKIIVLFMMLILSIAIVGCNNKEKVNVNFIIDDNTILVQLDKGSVITKDIVPLTKENKQTEIKLYYDEKYEKEYNNEKIESDITIYVKEEVVLDEETEKYIKQCYINSLNSSETPVSIDKIVIEKYYGCYNGAYVALLIRTDCMYLEVITSERVGGRVFIYPTSNPIKVFYNESVYFLTTAYLHDILSSDDIEQIYKIFMD
ncbi:MAG: hypothetical protein MR485_04900 [Mollicutes bacterium]|nr:hypothetical protein [Mollicutes bacterium]